MGTRAVNRAVQEARKVLAEESITRAPVPVERIAGKRARVTYEALPDKVSGILVPVQGKEPGFVIVVNENDGEKRKRFTIAHELGHLILHRYTTPHADKGFRFRLKDKTYSQESIREEIEANAFAAELLMPEALLKAALKDMGLDYAPEDEDEAVKDLADRFRVSEQALSIRLANILV